MVALVLIVATVMGGTSAARQPSKLITATDTVPPQVLAAAGDIACDPRSLDFNGGMGTARSCRQRFTSDILMDPAVTAVAPLGDNAYLCGSTGSYARSYAPTWGRTLDLTRPTTGNHEYNVSGPASTSTGCDSTNEGAKGYFSYFGSKAGDAGRGWYSYDLGAWHVVVLNSNCRQVLVGGCGPTSEQYRWLKADLEDASHASACTLAYWHHPLYAGGATSVPGSGDVPAADLRNFWDLLYASHADVVLNGHRHWYERFMPLDAHQVVDPANGIREFIVGTGGEDHGGDSTRGPISEAYDNKTFGVLKLTMHDTSYDWQFVPEVGAPLVQGRPFRDSGSTRCHQPSSDVSAPSAPTSVGAVVSPGTTRLDLSWTASHDDVGVVGYKVVRNGSPVSYTEDTSFTDATVAAGGSYTYTVQGYDQSGNESGPSDSAAVTVPGGSQTLQFTAVADAATNQVRPSASSGSGSRLQVDGNPRMRSYLRFNLSGLTGRQVLSAKLRLWTTNASPVGGTVSRTAATWSESTITWNRQPAPGDMVAQVGAVTGARSKLVDLGTLVTGDGVVDLVLTSTNADRAAYLSREASTDGRRPTVVVQVD